MKALVAFVLSTIVVSQFVHPTIASELAIDDLAVRSTKLEAAGQWPELVSLCETAARKGKLSNELYQRY